MSSFINNAGNNMFTCMLSDYKDKQYINSQLMIFCNQNNIKIYTLDNIKVVIR